MAVSRLPGHQFSSPFEMYDLLDLASDDFAGGVGEM